MNDDNDPVFRPLAVVTGASSGIGYELAKQFAEHGWDLVVAAEDDGIHQTKQAIETIGAQVESVQVDLSTYEGVERLWNRALELGRPIEAIAINAGIGVGGDFARDTDLRTELNLINLNVVSSVHLAKLAIRNMLEKVGGRVLFTSSIAATMAGSFEAVYSGSKAFIQTFAQAIREELRDTGITVTCLMPGPTETNFFHRAGMDDTKVGSDPKDDPAEVAREGFEAMMNGADHVIAGSFKNKLMAGAARVLPETLVAKLHRRMSEPGSGNG
jgi:short-subunit dehydrogenase